MTAPSDPSERPSLPRTIRLIQRGALLLAALAFLLPTTAPLHAQTLSDTVLNGQSGSFTVLPEGTVTIDNRTGDTVSIIQVTTGSPVILEVTDGDGSPGDFVDARVRLPAALLDDGDSASEAGLIVEVTLDADTASTTMAESANAPVGYEAPASGVGAIDIAVERRDGGSLSGDMDICLPYDATAEGEFAMFRFDGSAWQSLGNSSLAEAGLVCGTTRESGAFAAFSAPPLSADVNASGSVDAADALVLYYSYTLSSLVGGSRDSIVDCTDAANLAAPHFSDDSRAQTRREDLFTSLAGGGSFPSDDVFKQMICEADNWRHAALNRGGDINGDGRIDASDAVIMYLSYSSTPTLGDGCDASHAGTDARRRYLSGHRGVGPRTDAHYRNLIVRANTLRAAADEVISPPNCEPADITPVQTPTLATWEYEPILRMSVGGMRVADSGGTYQIPGSAVSTPVRLKLSIRVTQTSGDLSSEWSEFSGSLGIEGFKGSVVFSPTGAAATTDIATALTAATSQMNGSGSSATAPIVDAASSGDRWLLWWGQDLSYSASDGMQCTPASPGTDNSCEVPLGYLTFTPNLPSGGGISIRLAGYDRTDGAPEILPFESLLRDVDTTVTLTGASVALTRPAPTVTLQGSDATIVEGEAVTFTAVAERNLDEDAEIRLEVTGGTGITSGDYRITPAPATIAAGASSVVLTLEALFDTASEAAEEEMLQISISSASSSGVHVDESSGAWSVTIVDIAPLMPGSESVRVPDGDTLAALVSGLDVVVLIDNGTGEMVNISQGAADGEAVVLEVTDGDGAFAGTRIHLPASLLDDGEAASDDGVGFGVTLSTSTPAIKAAEASSDVPAGFNAPEGGVKAFDITVTRRDGVALARDQRVDICLPFDAMEEGVPAVFRFDGSAWQALGSSSVVEEGLVCGATGEFSAFAVFYISAVPDVNGDGEVTANDALILYYAFSLRAELGNGR